MTYKNTKSSRLLDQHGEEAIQSIWYIFGHKKTAEYFDTTASVIRGIVERKGWKRPIEFMPILKKAIDSGKRSPEEFTHIDFSGEFIQKLIKNINNEHPGVQIQSDNVIELALHIQQELLNKKTNKGENPCKLA